MFRNAIFRTEGQEYTVEEKSQGAKYNYKYMSMVHLKLGKYIYGAERGVHESIQFKDRCGIRDILISAGIIPLIITGRTSSIALKRGKELGITEYTKA